MSAADALRAVMLDWQWAYFLACMAVLGACGVILAGFWAYEVHRACQDRRWRRVGAAQVNECRPGAFKVRP